MPAKPLFELARQSRLAGLTTSSTPTHISDDEREYTQDSAIGFGPLPRCATPPVQITAPQTPSPSITSSYMCESTLHTAVMHQAATNVLPGSTIGYELAKQNLLKEVDLDPGRFLDTEEFAPLFVTGVLQLPGTLAAAMGCERKSELELLRHMTPGKLSFVQKEGEVPDPVLDVRGMLVLGRGKHNRRALDDWHGPRYIRMNVDVQIEMQHWVRKRLRAFTWARRDLLGMEVEESCSEDGWCSGSNASLYEIESVVGAERWTDGYYRKDHIGDGSSYHDNYDDWIEGWEGHNLGVEW